MCTLSSHGYNLVSFQVSRIQVSSFKYKKKQKMSVSESNAAKSSTSKSKSSELKKPSGGPCLKKCVCLCTYNKEEEECMERECKRRCPIRHRGSYYEGFPPQPSDPCLAEKHSFCMIQRERKATGCYPLPPKGLPWASGKLLYLPGHSAKYHQIVWNILEREICRITNRCASGEEEQCLEIRIAQNAPHIVVCPDTFNCFCKLLGLGTKMIEARRLEECRRDPTLADDPYCKYLEETIGGRPPSSETLQTVSESSAGVSISARSSKGVE